MRLLGSCLGPVGRVQVPDHIESWSAYVGILVSVGVERYTQLGGLEFH